MSLLNKYGNEIYFAALIIGGGGVLPRIEFYYEAKNIYFVGYNYMATN